MKLCPFIQTVTVGSGISPNQPINGFDRVADFTAGSELHRPPEQREPIFAQIAPNRARWKPWLQDLAPYKLRFPPQRYQRQQR